MAGWTCDDGDELWWPPGAVVGGVDNTTWSVADCSDEDNNMNNIATNNTVTSVVVGVGGVADSSKFAADSNNLDHLAACCRAQVSCEPMKSPTTR